MNTPSLLDYHGLICPEPITRLHALLKKHHPPALLVLVDNDAAQENVSRVLTHYAYKVESVAVGKTWRITATYDATNKTEPDISNNLHPAPNQKTLILLTDEIIGRNDNALGVGLMESFLATLPEMGESLWRIILLNAGVKLAATPGKSLESLKKLEASGIDILVCGSCLVFYDLMTAKAVGDTTNMLDVVTSLEVADKVIHP